MLVLEILIQGSKILHASLRHDALFLSARVILKATGFKTKRRLQDRPASHLRAPGFGPDVLQLPASLETGLHLVCVTVSRICFTVLASVSQ